jgi:superfamily I DNA/RNA helicase
VSGDRYQDEVVQAVRDTDDHVSVDALAGSGKSYTIRLCCEALPQSTKIGVWAFGRANAAEARSKVGRLANVDACTMHSIGFRYLKGAKVVTRETPLERALTAERFEKTWRPLRILERVMSEIPDANGDYDADQFRWCAAQSELALYPREIERMQRALRTRREDPTSEISYADQLYLPLVRGAFDRKLYDVIFVDERQDLSPIQREIVLRQAHRGARIVSVGDPNQAIYAWRGADSDSCDAIDRGLDGTTRSVIKKPLNICYRCSPPVIEYVRKHCNLPIEVSPHAIPGSGAVIETAETIHTNYLDGADGSMILARDNGTLLNLAVELLSREQSFALLGSTLEKTIKGLYADSREEAIEKLSARVGSAVKAIADASDEPKQSQRDIQRIKREAAAPMALLDGATSLADAIEVANAIDNSRANSPDAVVLSTAHRAKGLEHKRVKVIASGFQFGDQEDNLWYVALTRAEDTLEIVGERRPEGFEE